MATYILLLLEPRQGELLTFQKWRKEVLFASLEFRSSLYLDAVDIVSSTNIYRHANIYQLNNDTLLTHTDIEKHLQSYLRDGPLASYHWQLHSYINGLRQSELTAATVITVGMTIPQEADADQKLNQWYDEEHIPGLATVPGWLAGTRLKLVHASDPNVEWVAPYVAIHEWGDPNDLGGDMWKKAVMTPWTEKISELQTAPMHRRVWKISI
ncbi:hypothetical protein V491_02586 [Pseudogymnoascus sp. VKM F-3775]|nr:hypothetical protein V491_02586 [Pseudogymnoascus sp. VKM F-3775]